jgi:MFS family permease
VTPLDAAGVRRRYLVLQALRWLPTGLLIPVLILLLTGRGFSLTEIGVAAAAQGLLVFLLELPTGGLADALGRRPVLLLGAAVDIVSMTLLVVADSIPVLVAVFALQGVYRALESGPLEAWYVDATHAADPAADVTGGLAAGGVVLGLAIAAGALASGALVALDPVAGADVLVIPIVASIALRVVNLGAVARLMTEIRPGRGMGVLRRSVAAVPGVVGDAVGHIRASRVLTCLIFVELFWGFGMVTFEVLLPPKLSAVAGGPDKAASLLGPAVAVAWLASAAGAALVPRLQRRFGSASAAMAIHTL